MIVADWVAPAVAGVSATAAWAALGIALYNTHALRRDRVPRVELAARWNLPNDVPQASKGPGSPATANPGEVIFQCEITNTGVAGVKINEVHVYIDAPPGKPMPLHLPQGEQPRKLDNGDSQMWASSPLTIHAMSGIPTWLHVLALDTAGNRHEVSNTQTFGANLPR